MKNLRAVTTLLIANAVSGVAQGITMIAIPWYFTSIMDKTQLFGVIYFIVTLVSLFWGPSAGTIVDKFNRKKIMLTITGSGTVLIATLATLTYLSNGEQWIYVALVFGVTVFIYNIHYPNLYAFAQEITEISNYGRITSYLEIQGQSTFAIAGAIGAILLTGTDDGVFKILGRTFDLGFKIDAWPLHKIFFFDAFTYIVSFLLLSSIKYESLFHKEKSRLSFLKRFKQGVSFLRENRLIFIFGNASYFVFATILVSGFFLIPKYVDAQLQEGAEVYAWGEMFFALGSLFAGFLINRVFDAKGPVKGIIVLSCLASLVYFSLVFNIWAGFFYFAYLLIGLANAGIRILRMTYIFKTVPNNVIGRLGSIFMVINTLFRLFFILLFSISIFTVGNHVVYAFFILGIFTLCGMSILIYYLKPLRALTRN
ncbi:MAG: MFS transporter [Chitinophagales bacterium]|nr:MFS transporter [Chitinophagales bacterium]